MTSEWGEMGLVRIILPEKKIPEEEERSERNDSY